MTPLILFPALVRLGVHYGHQSKIVYTDPMTVPDQKILDPGDGMCGGDNYRKREKNNCLIRKYHKIYTPGVSMDPCCTDEG